MDYWSVLKKQFKSLEEKNFPDIRTMPHLWVLAQECQAYLIEVEGVTRLLGDTPVTFSGKIAPNEGASSISYSNGVVDEQIGRCGLTDFDAHGNVYSDNNPYGGTVAAATALTKHSLLGIWDGPGFYNRKAYYPVSSSVLGDRFIRVICSANVERTPEDESAEFIMDADNVIGLYYAAKVGFTILEEQYFTHFTKHSGPNKGNRVTSFTMDESALPERFHKGDSSRD